MSEETKEATKTIIVATVGALLVALAKEASRAIEKCPSSRSK